MHKEEEWVLLQRWNLSSLYAFSIFPCAVWKGIFSLDALQKWVAKNEAWLDSMFSIQEGLFLNYKSVLASAVIMKKGSLDILFLVLFQSWA